MNQLNFDKLLYPIMMSIRSLRTYFKQEDDNNRIILDCQNKVEAFVLTIIHFILDLIVNGSGHTQISFNKNTSQLQRELRNKFDCIQTFVQTKDVASLKKDILKFYDLKEGFSESESEDDGVTILRNFIDVFQFTVVFKSNWYELGPLIRQTGKIKEFNPEIQQLRLELDEKESTIQALKSKLKYRQNSMEQMAHNHHKEVSVLKAQFVLNPQPDDPQSIFDIKYFDQTQMLDQEIVALMNEKINDIKNQYERYVKQFMEKFQKQRVPQNNEDKIKNPSFDDFTSKDLLKIALDKESNPYIFIKQIQDLKSINYILNVLSNQQKHYGIDYDQINNAFKTKNEDLKKIVDTRILMEDCQAQISALFLVDQQKKKEEIVELNQMITQQDVEYKQQLKLFEDLLQNTNENSKQMILNQQQKIEHMKSENHNLSTMLLNQKQHQQQLNTLGLDKYDLLKEKSAPIKDILNKLNNLEGCSLVTLIQEVTLLLYQVESVKVVNYILDRGKLNKYTQTINVNQEFIEQKEEKKIIEKKEQKIIMKHLEEIKQETIKKNKLKIASTQTDTINEINSTQYFDNIQEQKTIISQSEQCGTVSLNMLLKQYQSSQDQKQNSNRDLTPEPTFEKHNSVFEKLYTQQKYENPRWHQLKPLIEKLAEEEFLEVINTLGIYSYRQQQQTQNTTMEIPQYDISRIQQSMTNKSINKRKRDSSVDQTKNLFIELDEQRENALKLFEQQRIDTYRRRIKRLVPVQPSQCLQVEEKLRPKSQIRSNYKKSNY